MMESDTTKAGQSADIEAQVADEKSGNEPNALEFFLRQAENTFDSFYFHALPMSINYPSVKATSPYLKLTVGNSLGEIVFSQNILAGNVTTLIAILCHGFSDCLKTAEKIQEFKLVNLYDPEKTLLNLESAQTQLAAAIAILKEKDIYYLPSEG